MRSINSARNVTWLECLARAMINPQDSHGRASLIDAVHDSVRVEGELIQAPSAHCSFRNQGATQRVYL